MTEETSRDPEQKPQEYPQAGLERAFIEEYLVSKGYHLKDIHDLPEETAKTLMTEACAYASRKLVEIETRSHLVDELHGRPPI